MWDDETANEEIKMSPTLPTSPRHCRFNSFPLGQNGRHFPDDIIKSIFMNEKFCIVFQISLRFVPKGSIDNKPAYDQVMAWRRPGDKPLSEPMLTQFANAYMRHSGEMS